MKVLFAVSSESISDAIIKRYQKEYKEILSYKNVYYFNAILKEIQKDKSYDRIVISEDLEPFSNNNYDTIDKFIFEKLDNISDEAHDSQGKETSIILICTDRHTKGSSFLVKLFGIGVYNALLGNDRSMDQVCKLISKPRVKKEAKMYYKIDADDVSYDPKSEKEVSELEIQNILNHFKKIAKNKDKYADSFNNIASQYTDEQLKIIINCLPIGVKAVLEEDCPKYQELMSAGGMIQRVGGQANLQTKEAEQKTGIKIDILESKLTQPKMSGPIVIPSSVRTASSKGPIKVRQVENVARANDEEPRQKVVKKISKNPVPQENIKQEDDLELDSLLSDIDDIEETSLVQNTSHSQENAPVTKANPKDLASVFEEEDNNDDDSLLMSLNDESDDLDNDSDDLLLGLDDEEDDELLSTPSVEDDFDSNSDDLLIGLDDEEDDELLSMPSFEDEEDEEDSDTDSLLMSLNDEEDNVEESFDEDFDALLPSFDDEEPLEETVIPNDQTEPVSENKTITIKRGRGRPRKYPVDTEPKPKGKRGRPRKNPIEEEIEDEDDSLELILDNDDNMEDNIIKEETSSITPDMFLNQEESEDDDMLPILGDDELEEFVDEDEFTDEDDSLLVSLDEEDDFESSDDLLVGLEEVDEDDSLLVSLDEDDTFEVIEDEEEFTDEVALPDVDDLDDIDDDSLLMSLDGDDDFEVVEVDEEEYSDEVALPNVDDLDDLDDYQDDNDSDDMLPGMDYEEFDEDDYLLSGSQEQVDEDDDLLLTLDEDIPSASNNMSNTMPSSDFSDNLEDDEPILNQSYNDYKTQEANAIESIKPQVDYSMSTLNSLLTKDKKIVTFIGTTKNGTSFLINNLAALFASLGINTAVLDMTQNRNSYYIYTKNEEELRKIAYTSIEKLENGFAEGIRVDKNLTVYTALPNNGKNYTNAEPILSTLVQNHSLVLIDCDFDTDPSYFASCQEIYLVQSMDILTIQPLTSFLRDLKAKGVLESEKVRVVINKEIKVRSLTSKVIIGGMSFYNDPAMSFMTELFNKDMVKACSIPFEDLTYSKYLDSMVNCNVSLNGYSKAFLSKLRILGDMVYPLTSKQTYSNPTQNNYKKNVFSNSMNNTLNQMKNKF